MKIKTRICLVTTISLITCCVVLCLINFLSTKYMMKDIKKLEIDNGQKAYTRLVDIEDKEDKNIDRLLIGLLVVVTIGGAATFIAVSTALKPVKNLTKKIKDFHTADLKTPIPLPKAKDESYELISSYNIMLARLNHAFEREKRITANIAHEFKTPLSVLMTSCEVLEMKEKPTEEDYKKIVNLTKEKADYLAEITNSLLAIHRKTQTLNNVPCDLQQLLYNIKDDLLPNAKSKKIEININCEPLNIKCDKILFSQMINNFVENSIKYNYENGTIDVTVNTDNEDNIKIVIADTGKGIPDKDKSLIFEPFYRVDESRNKDYGGVGLGMPFAKTVADLYRGEILVEDNNPKGTKITISIPKNILEI